MTLFHGMQRDRFILFSGFSAILSVTLLCSCTGGMQMHKPDQGLFGTFSTYGLTQEILDCKAEVTQFEKDFCRKQNERVVEEPYHGSFKIRNLTTSDTKEVELDSKGDFRIQLDPGEYEVCVNGECSDPIEIRMGVYSTYGQRLPRPVEAAKSQK